MSPPKKPARKPTRAQRLAAARRKRERRGLVLRLAAGGIALSLLAVLAYSAIGGGPGDDDILTANGCTFDTRHDGTASAESDHIDNPTYAVDPPAGGAHNPTAASPGFYRAGQPKPRDGELVHATQHGFVVLWYRSDLGATLP